ncbi:MAG: hypothetical protein ACRCUS_04150 [Anaerovoracaceae bacterium]
MKNYILYVPETQQEFDSLKALTGGATPNLVLWQESFYEPIAGIMAPSTLLTVKVSAEAEEETEAVKDDTTAVSEEEIVETIPEDTKEPSIDFEAVSKVIELHGKQIQTLAAFFNEKMLPVDFYGTKPEDAEASE